MAAQTVLMDFILHENFDSNSCEQKVKDMLEEQLAKGGTDSNVLKVEMRHAGKEVDTVMYSGQGDLMIMIRIDKKLLTLIIDCPCMKASVIVKKMLISFCILAVYTQF